MNSRVFQPCLILIGTVAAISCRKGNLTQPLSADYVYHEPGPGR